jgi:hypothetical protein
MTEISSARRRRPSSWRRRAEAAASSSPKHEAKLARADAGGASSGMASLQPARAGIISRLPGIERSVCGYPGRSAPEAVARGTEAPARRPTKTTLILDLLGRGEGASISELMDATGWLPHTTRRRSRACARRARRSPRANARTGSRPTGSCRRSRSAAPASPGLRPRPRLPPDAAQRVKVADPGQDRLQADSTGWPGWTSPGSASGGEGSSAGRLRPASRERCFTERSPTGSGERARRSRPRDASRFGTDAQGGGDVMPRCPSCGAASLEPCSFANGRAPCTRSWCSRRVRLEWADLPKPVGGRSRHHRDQVERPRASSGYARRAQDHRIGGRRHERSPDPALRVYTRVSTDHGLDQEFNSLDNQREAAEAYIKSQAHEGWRCLPAHYDDGGFSGGSTGATRPPANSWRRSGPAGSMWWWSTRWTASHDPRGLRQARELFDAHGVSFVSVTQAFNTTSSMGRLTLNVAHSWVEGLRAGTRDVASRAGPSGTRSARLPCPSGPRASRMGPRQKVVSSPTQPGQRNHAMAP